MDVLISHVDVEDPKHRRVRLTSPDKRLDSEHEERRKQRDFSKVANLIKEHIRQGKEPSALQDMCLQLLESNAHDLGDFFRQKGRELFYAFMFEQLIAGLDFVVDVFPDAEVHEVWQASGNDLVDAYFSVRQLQYASGGAAEKDMILGVLQWLCHPLDKDIVLNVAATLEPRLKARFPRDGCDAIFKDFHAFVSVDSVQPTVLK